MAAERLRVRDVRKLFQIHFEQGLSQELIARAIGCGKTTVREYLYRARSAGLTSFSEIEHLSDDQIQERLGFKRVSGSNASLRKPELVMPDWNQVHLEKLKPNVTLMLLWVEYCDRVGAGAYGYTQFWNHYKRWSKSLSVVMRQDHRGGEKAFVDYCDGIFLTDPRTGERRKTQLFVGCLGASSYTFAEATMSQTLPDWIGSHCKMWSFFGGVSAITVCDNLRSGVSVANRYEPLINESYREMATHYGTCIIPARSYKPRDKAKVEAAVLVAQRWILARLRHQTFYDMSELNTAIDVCLEYLNNRKMRHLQKSRTELYQELDRPLLKSLPAKSYEFAEWKDARVNIDYHVTVDFHHYSTPFQLVHQLVQVRSTATAIEIFHRGSRVASHLRSYLKGKHTTKPEHMPKSHREHAEWTPSRIIDWAKSLGCCTGELVERIISKRNVPEQGFRSALGVIRLEKKYGRDRLEIACGRAIELGAISYGFVAEMLKNKMDFAHRKQDPAPMPSSFDPVTNEEQLSLLGAENVRGDKYYH